MRVVGSWQRRQIEAVKLEIRSELDRRTRNRAFDRLAHINAKIRELESDESIDGSMRRYLYVMHALVTHERQGGLSSSQVDRLVELGYAILQTSGIHTDSRELGALYGDLHTIKSQILRQSGDHLSSVWEQGLAQRFSGPSPTGGAGFPHFVAANRALRLGHAAIAISGYARAEREGLSDQALARNRLAHATALRLAGHLEKSEHMTNLGIEATGPKDPLRSEFTWNRLLLDFGRSYDMRLLTRATERRGTHVEAGYVIEASLWAHASPERKAIDEVRSISGLARRRALDPRQYGYLFKATKTLSELYDTAVPITIRQMRLGECLAKRDLLLNVDKELLVLACSIRWLARAKSFWLAAICLAEYQGLSLKLSGGRSRCALGILRDIDARDWPESQGIGGFA